MAEDRSATGTLAGIAALEGAVMMAAGGLAWLLVKKELASAHIAVERDAALFAGRKVAGPVSAYAQARVIDRHSLQMTGGKAFADLEGDHPHRETAMSASFMRASLFTSVMAFGVSAMAMVVGFALVVLGLAVRSAARRSR